MIFIYTKTFIYLLLFLIYCNLILFKCHFIQMSFYSTLDEEGKKLYDAYIKASDAWTEYCRPKVFTNFNDYLNKTNRKFDRYEFYTHKYNKKNDEDDEKNYEDDEKNDDKNDDNVKKIYKFLSKKLHPDRFKKPNSDKFFSMINEANQSGNETFLKSILDKIDSITNFTDEEFNDFFVNLNKNSLSSRNDDLKLFDSMQYKLFCDPSYKKCVNSMYVTEEEIMKQIENAYDYSFVEFYLNRYKDNDNIKKACAIRMVKENEKLKEEIKKNKEEIEENKRLKEEIEKNKKLKEEIEIINKSPDKH